MFCGGYGAIWRPASVILWVVALASGKFAPLPVLVINLTSAVAPMSNGTISTNALSTL